MRTNDTSYFEDADGLLHYGVKGMRWGVRRGKAERQAQKDAKEFARAKMFYGEGAGTRRKLIREKVESNKKKDPRYAKAFDDAYSSQDLGKHGDKATGERKRKDRTTKTKQSVGQIARRLTGEQGNVAAITAGAIAGGIFLNSPRGRDLLNRSYSAAAKPFKDSARDRQTRKWAEDFINSL